MSDRGNGQRCLRRSDSPGPAREAWSMAGERATACARGHSGRRVDLGEVAGVRDIDDGACGLDVPHLLPA
jgi:hypothetical protein